MKAAAVKPIPEGYTSVTPWVVGEDTAGLMKFMEDAFGAEEESRILTPEGRIGHAEMRIGNAMVMMFDAPDGWPATPAFLRLYVEDADATMYAAINAGATLITKVTLLSFGDRVGRVRDPFGNVYWIQQRVENVGGEEMLRRWDSPKWQEAMAYVQSSLKKAVK
jgi:PhnB protein